MSKNELGGKEIFILSWFVFVLFSGKAQRDGSADESTSCAGLTPESGLRAHSGRGELTLEGVF